MNTPQETPDKTDITAVIVAGGRSSRFGGNDKGLLEFRGKTLVEHIIEKIAPQVDKVIINANRNIDEYSKLGLPIVRDASGDYQGPLAGISAALDAVTTPYLLTVPCDSPLVPEDLVQQLAKVMTKQGTDIAIVHDGERMQHMFMLLSCSLAQDLRNYYASGQRAIKHWLSHHKVAHADFSDHPDAFANINSEEDLARLERKA